MDNDRADGYRHGRDVGTAVLYEVFRLKLSLCRLSRLLKNGWNMKDYKGVDGQKGGLIVFNIVVRMVTVLVNCFMLAHVIRTCFLIDYQQKDREH